MIGSGKLRRALLRWDRLITAVVLGLPFMLTVLLGFLWLMEHGFLLLFILVSAVLGGGVFLARYLVRRQVQKQPSSHDSQQAQSPEVEADPDWLPLEKAVFAEVCQQIENLTGNVLPWQEMPAEAVNVINEVAGRLGKKDKHGKMAGKGKTALQFTLPEAMLLLERSASRYREYLKSRVPFSDQVSLATLHWFWRQRQRATLLWKLARGGSRLTRFAISPAAGVLREIEQMIAGGNSGYLSEQMLGTMQAVLLEEVAYAAVELYSGRLRFSDAELLQIQLATTEADRERLARPDAPLRFVFVGQTSSGKSTLINALLEEELAETDVSPTTDTLVAYETQLDDIPCRFLDSPGLDGSKKTLEFLLEELIRADMVVWVVRANRPARAPDLKLIQAFDNWFAQHHERRKPQVIAVATGMDALAETWPYPEHELPGGVQQIFAAAVNAIARDLEGLKPRPVSSISPAWNLEGVVSAMRNNLGNALLVQRNRRRIDAAKQSGGLFGEARKGARGMAHGGKMLGSRIVKKKTNPDKPGGSS